MGARRVVLAIALAAAALLAAPAAARACSCAAIAPETQLELADGAVVARLIEFVPRGPQVADYRYRVREVYKGKRRLEVGQTLVIRAARYDAACGLPRGEGRRFGLFLHRGGGRWQASLCDVTTPQQMRDAAAGDGDRRQTPCGS